MKRFPIEFELPGSPIPRSQIVVMASYLQLRTEQRSMSDSDRLIAAGRRGEAVLQAAEAEMWAGG